MTTSCKQPPDLVILGAPFFFKMLGCVYLLKELRIDLPCFFSFYFLKDLDVLYKQQAKALQDPISFVEKLQNNVNCSIILQNINLLTGRMSVLWLSVVSTTKCCNVC